MADGQEAAGCDRSIALLHHMGAWAVIRDCLAAGLIEAGGKSNVAEPDMCAGHEHADCAGHCCAGGGARRHEHGLQSWAVCWCSGRACAVCLKIGNWEAGWGAGDDNLASWHIELEARHLSERATGDADGGHGKAGGLRWMRLLQEPRRQSRHADGRTGCACESRQCVVSDSIVL